MGHVIGVAVAKGGTGKTATVTNIATILAMKGKKVAVIDFDSQGDASKCFGINVDSLKFSLFDVFLQEKRMKDIVCKAYGVDVYPAKQDLAGLKQLAEENPDIYPDYRFMLKGVIAEIRNKYDFIFVDLPPTPSSQYLINTLTAADQIIIPLQYEYLAADGVATTLKEIQTARENTNPGLKILGIVATMYISGTNLSADVVQESRRHFLETGVKMFETVIPRSVKFGDAPRYKKPAILLYPSNAAIKSYVALTEEMIIAL